ncbi:MAG: hypothetical protein ACYTEZ_14840 [Planctomycetota bacterium]|jgi:hypothetical protein
MQRRKPRTGLLILFVAVGSGGVGFLSGRFLAGEEGQAVRPGRAPARLEAVLAEEALVPDDFDLLAESNPADFPEPLLESEEADADLPTPSELLDSLRQHAATDKSQMILLGMVANAARLGPAALPEIKQLLRSGVDIKFPSYTGKGLGFPSLRVALMAAAEATGDPAAQELIAEVAETSESPVEVVFSAHLLDRLDALDARTAQRTLDSLAGQLTPEQKKAMGAVVWKVVPAAAAADPGYAETFLINQLRMEKDRRADPRFVVPVLDGLPADRARDLVLSSLTAADVDERSKRLLASRATQRELPLLAEMRHAVESNIVSPRIASTIAHSAVGGRAYMHLERAARRAVKQGDLNKARGIAHRYRQRLGEAQLTITAARNMGARLRNDINTHARLRQQRLDALRWQIGKAFKKQQQAQQQQAKKKN